MGWMFTHRAKGTSDRQWFENKWGPELSKRIVATTTKNGVFYAALECDDARLLPNAAGKRIVALVIKLKWVPKDHYNFGYKDMDEFMGPCETDCPAKILKLLSPFEPKALEEALKKRAEVIAKGEETWSLPSILNAHDWRECCWQAVKARSNLQVGSTYKAPRLIRFRDGVETDLFRLIEKKGRRKIWRRPDGMPVRLTEDLVNSLVSQS